MILKAALVTSEALQDLTPGEIPESDEALMSRYRDGDAAAFEVLYGRHKGPVFRFLLRQCRDRGRVEELFQEVWMRVIQGRARYEARAKFRTWLYTIARHRLVDLYREQGREDLEVDDSAGVKYAMVRIQEQPENLLVIREDAARLIAGIEALPEMQREAVLLKQEAGMSLEEIAELTGVNTETVKSRLRYAVKKLKQVMQHAN